MAYRKINTLVADDNTSYCTILQALLHSWGYKVALTYSGRAALEQIRRRVFDLVLCDVRTAEMDGVAVLKEIKALSPAVPILIIMAFSSVETAVRALKTGALDYLVRPLDFDHLQETLEKALARTRETGAEPLSASAAQFNMIGSSPAVQQLSNGIAMVASLSTTVLIHGDSGTGKELAARALHASGARHDKPLVALNYAALNRSLLESKLFGHERSTFTKTDKRREGRFVKAGGGTLFLNGIGDISPPIQMHLLWAIQGREVQWVDSDQTITIDVRLIATTHHSLTEEVSAGRFRQNFYYRLNVVAIGMPALCQRRKDIPLLAERFLQCSAARSHRTVKGSTPQTMNLLIHYDWLGNIRELEDAIEHPVVLLTGEYTSGRELPMTIATIPVRTESSGGIQPLVNVEREVILAALGKTGGNKVEAAHQSGIIRKTLLTEVSR